MIVSDHHLKFPSRILTRICIWYVGSSSEIRSWVPHFSFSSQVPISWRTIFLNFNYLSGRSQKLNEFTNFIELSTTFGHFMDPTSKYILDKWNFYKWLFKNVYQILPMFSFYIYRVDKKIFKNTRGKSGKHTFIWKYVSPYKRMFLVMHWLLKELRVKQGRSLSDRLLLLFKSVISSPKSTWAYKVKKFSHNYVYRNSRKTLAETYRTSTK